MPEIARVMGGGNLSTVIPLYGEGFPARMTDAAAERGLFYFWERRALYVGPGLVAGLHAHHAVQLFVGLEEPVPLRAGPSSEWRRYAGAVVSPDRTHQSAPAVPLLATLWLEAESAEARALIGSEPIQALDSALLSPLRRELLNCWHGRYRADRAGELVDEVIATLRSQPTPTRIYVDARVERARELLRSAAGGRATLRGVAGAVGLSHSRLTHLFSEQLGLPPGRYLIWVRLRHALEALSTGASVADAAHGSGFADGPHLSRTFREMLGFPPSAALQVSRFVHARASETE